MPKRIFFIGILFTLIVACSTNYNIVGYNYHNWSIDQKTDSVKDDGYLNVIKPYKDKLNSDLNEVVAYADTSLVAYRPESPLSNFISDLIFNFGKKWMQANNPSVKIDFSLENNGGLRTSIPKGDVRIYNIYELLPFENELVLLNLSGSQVEMLVNHIAYREGEGVSGIKFGMKSGKAVNIIIQGKPLDLNGDYWLITNDYLANGGDGMAVLKLAKQKILTSEKIRDAVINELRELKASGQFISGKSDGRIYNVD